MPYKPGDRVMIIKDSKVVPHGLPITSIHIVKCDLRESVPETDYPISINGGINLQEDECILAAGGVDAS